MDIDPIRLEVYKHLLSAIPEEMGAVLRKGSYSPNIKERRDYSCAIFDASGEMVAQAAHIPVHLGSMPLSVTSAVNSFDRVNPGDVIILNDPFRGGTHLPDITLVSPVYIPGLDGTEKLFGFVASRAHHADVGGMAPGSMPVAREIYQEGLILPPIKLVEGGKLNQGVWDLILANVRTPVERAGDLAAQLAANQRGVNRLQALVSRYGEQEVAKYTQALLAYAEKMTRQLLRDLPEGVYRFQDLLDDDGIHPEPIPISVSIEIKGDQATVDFSGTAEQAAGSVNAVFAITLSAVFYVFRCLIGLDIPNNSGCLRPIRVIAPAGTVVNAKHPAAVAGGNVETSQRIVDVLFGALAQACPVRVPAASQGSMNNLLIGGWDNRRSSPFTYYETIAGGAGARPGKDGPSAIHTHMTNTLNTPIEALEFTYPLRVLRYEIRRGSGGSGLFQGGNGVRRDIQLLTDAQVTLLTERRRTSPYGLAGGNPGEPGQNCLIRDGEEQSLPGKGSFYLKRGDILSIRTPGGGGYGDIRGGKAKHGDSSD
ncbi:MAG TPA: hydantoinase B/oxoprolinase family protein [Anaerolineales bacterium]|nr:hydantoinase B/oxoprolinase family protein [Anaerolineales bacterium]